MYFQVIVMLTGLMFAPICEGYDLIFLSTTNEIHYANMSNFDGHTTYIPLINTTDVSSVDYDPLEEYVYWADVNKGIIVKARLNGSDENILIESVNASTITLDVESRMIYWTDTSSHTIERSDLGVTDKQILVDEFLDQPRSIVLDKGNGKMYWAESGINPRIERANLDGSVREELVHTPLGTRLVLTLDTTKRQMYWADGGLDHIMSSDMDGKHQQEIYKTNSNPSSMDFYDDNIYWSVLVDDDTSKILKLKTSSCSDNDTADVIFTGIFWRLFGLKAATTSDGKEILLLAETEGLLELDLGIERDLGRPIESFQHFQPTGIDFDPIDDKLYSVLYGNQTIISVFRNGTDLKTLTTNIQDKRLPSNLAISLDTKEIFWSMPQLGTIERMTLFGINRETYKSNLRRVVALALDVENRYVYWASFLKEGDVKCAKYTGDEEKTLVGDVMYPSSIVLDLPNNTMYIAAAAETSIYQYKLDGTEIGKLKAKENIYYMTMMGDFLYFYEKDSSLYRINKNDDNQLTVLRSGNEGGFTSFKIIRTSCLLSPCKNNGTCINGIESFNCSCIDGFSGTLCETDIDECVGVTCHNNGTCVDKINSYYCNCLPGFTGRQCQTDTDECVSNPCQNNGTCVDVINGYMCSCVQGFVGDRCESDHDNCKEIFCHNNGICVNEIDGYRCSCLTGFIGENCETGLGYIAFAVGSTLFVAAMITYGLRRTLIRRKKNNSTLNPPHKKELHSLVHLPSFGNSGIYMLNDL